MASVRPRVAPSWRRTTARLTGRPVTASLAQTTVRSESTATQAVTLVTWRMACDRPGRSDLDEVPAGRQPGRERDDRTVVLEHPQSAAEAQHLGEPGRRDRRLAPLGEPRFVEQGPQLADRGIGGRVAIDPDRDRLRWGGGHPFDVGEDDLETDHRPLGRAGLEGVPADPDPDRLLPLRAGRLEPEAHVTRERETGPAGRQAVANGHRVHGPLLQPVRHEDLGPSVPLESTLGRRRDREVGRHVGDAVLVEGQLDPGPRGDGRLGIPGQGAEDVDRSADLERPRRGPRAVRPGEVEPVGLAGGERPLRAEGHRPGVRALGHGERSDGRGDEAGGECAGRRRARAGQDERRVAEDPGGVGPDGPERGLGRERDRLDRRPVAALTDRRRGRAGRG